MADAAAPQAAILAGQGTRDGLLQSPVALSCSLDRIVVLQTTDAVPQGALAAFDVKGNPVPCFAGNASSVALRSEGSARVQVVDVSVEAKNYIYVLKYLAPRSGAVPATAYRLDLYNPDGSFLTQVAGLAAARLHVDLWRNLFTLNYEIVARLRAHRTVGVEVDPLDAGRDDPDRAGQSTPPRAGLTGPDATRRGDHR